MTPFEFNSYGARRGHHEVMMRGTFGNIRLRNALAGKEGPVHDVPARRQGDVPVRRVDALPGRGRAAGHPRGAEYGSGSSRDWAAKGTRLLGVRAVIAQSYERIHRSNLVGMGVLPLQFLPGESAASLGLEGREAFDITGLGDGLAPRRSWSSGPDRRPATARSGSSADSMDPSSWTTTARVASCLRCCDVSPRLTDPATESRSR